MDKDTLMKIPYTCKHLLGNMSRNRFYKTPELVRLIIKIGHSSYLSEQDVLAWIAKQRKTRPFNEAVNKPAA